VKALVCDSLVVIPTVFTYRRGCPASHERNKRPNRPFNQPGNHSALPALNLSIRGLLARLSARSGIPRFRVLVTTSVCVYCCEVRRISEERASPKLWFTVNNGSRQATQASQE
jgi:hypothetical protein